MTDIKTTFYLNGKKISRKTAAETAGKSKIEKMIEESKATFIEEPFIENSYMVKGGILTIKFN